VHPKEFTHYLSVVRAKGKYYAGISPKKYYYSEGTICWIDLYWSNSFQIMPCIP